jgi:YVTN family beta-propeller protein
VDPKRDVAYVANSLVSTVSVVDLDSRRTVDTIPVQRAPIGVTIGPSGDRLYVANRGAGTISVIDLDARREWARVPVGPGPADAAVDEMTGTVWATNSGVDYLSFFEDRLMQDPGRVLEEEPFELIGKRLPPFQLPEFRSGERFSSEALRGKKFILNFFANW